MFASFYLGPIRLSVYRLAYVCAGVRRLRQPLSEEQIRMIGETFSKLKGAADWEGGGGGGFAC